MNIEILCVGKIKESYLKEAIAEYVKRLGRYCTLKITEVDDEKTPESRSDALTRSILAKEGERLLRKLRDTAMVIVLAVDGKMLDSEELADCIKKQGVSGVSNIQFVIGGSLGLSDEIRKRAGLTLSFSRMTFPHQLMRLILLEQIYRIFRIINHEPYHK